MTDEYDIGCRRQHCETLEARHEGMSSFSHVFVNGMLITFLYSVDTEEIRRDSSATLRWQRLSDIYAMVYDAMPATEDAPRELRKMRRAGCGQHDVLAKVCSPSCISASEQY